MTVWIMSANERVYNHAKAFEEQGYIDWKQTRKYAIGDYVFIYCTKPSSRIKYMTIVTDIGLTRNDLSNDKDYWIASHSKYNESDVFFRLSLLQAVDDEQLGFEFLKKHGLEYAPQSPTKMRQELQIYLKPFFNGNGGSQNV